MPDDKWSWNTADDGNIVGRTDVKDNGKVESYPYKTPNNMEEGHGHYSYNSMDDFINENPSYSRHQDNPNSIGKSWKVPSDYILIALSELTFFELQLLEYNSENNYVKRSARFLIERFQTEFLESNNNKTLRLIKRK